MENDFTPPGATQTTLGEFGPDGAVMTKTLAYTAGRNLISSIAYANADGTLIAKRDYGYDALDRVNSRVQTRGNGESATTRTDAFGYNTRSELTSATLGNAAYAYAFDYIGNRNSASEAGTQLAYTANALNQYSTVTETDAFTPTYDADGNATLVQTATGTWSISYNGENRPVRFENAGTQTVVECGYDSLGRRFEKKVTVAGTLVLHERYAYRGYLQIAAFDVAGTLKRVIYWDPTEETATRPLAVNILGDNVYFPTVDLTKNVCELVDFYGNVAATYDYAPFGAVSAGTPSGSAVPANPLQWASEIYDSELDLVYYNYRHYSPALGRFLSRDPIEEQGGLNLYAFVENQILFQVDMLGFKGRSGRPKQRPVFPGGVGAPINPLLPKSPPFIDEIDGGFYEEKNRLAIMLILRELILNGEKICEAGVREKPAYKERKCKPSSSKGCCVMTLQFIREFPARTNWWGKYIPGSGEVVSIVSINFSYLPYDCGFVQFIFERKEPVETFFEKYPL